MRYRLLGLDLDGTALDPSGALSDEVRQAVREARRRGLQVVLCTGRRRRTALPVAQELQAEGEIVLHNGAVVKELACGTTLRNAYLAPELYGALMAVVWPEASPLVYVDDPAAEVDILIDGREPHAYQGEYLADHGSSSRVVTALGARAPYPVVMVSLMGDPASLRRIEERVGRALPGRVATRSIENKNYRGRILELFAPGEDKWTALRWVGERRGIPPEAIAAVGDDSNDAPMLAGAGLGIAMGNAVPAALAAADRVVASNAAAGAVEAIEWVLRG